jgi:Protein of unknown function (DUF3489)
MAKPKPRTGQSSGKQKQSSKTRAKAATPASKTSACLALLRRPEGATIGELQEISGWQPHSVRSFLAGTIKKRLQLQVASAKEERGRVYRVLA